MGTWNIISWDVCKLLQSKILWKKQSILPHKLSPQKMVAEIQDILWSFHCSNALSKNNLTCFLPHNTYVGWNPRKAAASGNGTTGGDLPWLSYEEILVFHGESWIPARNSNDLAAECTFDDLWQKIKVSTHQLSLSLYIYIYICTHTFNFTIT